MSVLERLTADTHSHEHEHEHGQLTMTLPTCDPALYHRHTTTGKRVGNGQAGQLLPLTYLFSLRLGG